MKISPTEYARFALLRAKIELELVDEPDFYRGRGQKYPMARKGVRESTLRTIREALDMLDKANPNGFRNTKGNKS